MRICQVITRLIIGGAQENTLLTCEGLHDRGHQVLLLAGPDTGPEGSLWEQARKYGYQVETIRSLHRAIRPLHDLQGLRELSDTFGRFQPQIIHTHSSKAGILARLAAAGASGAKVVHTIHGMSFNRTQSLLVQAMYRELEAAAAARTDRLVAVADAMADQAALAGLAPRNEIMTIPSGMRTEWFQPDPNIRGTARRAWDVHDDHIVVGTVARLFHGKGYEQLIPVAAEAVKANPDLRFVWIGDGSERGNYVHALERLGLRDRVTLLGLLPPREVAHALQGCDVLVHCSQWEGLPRAVVQALLLEVPVAAFDIDGTAEVVLPGSTGKIVPLNDLQALVDAILQLAGDSGLRRRMGKLGRQLCLARFDYRYMIDQLEELYEQLLGDRLPSRAADEV